MMHELSIALSMIEEIEEQMKRHRGSSVEAVYVRVGVFSGVDPRALRFAYELACEGTVLENSRLEIEPVDLLVFCPACATTRTADPHHVFCPRCLTPEQQILKGRELEVRALELFP